MRSWTRVEKLMMSVIIAALAVAAIASWSTWSVTDAPARAQAATRAPSPAGSGLVTGVVGPADGNGGGDGGGAGAGSGGGSGPDGAMTSSGTSAVALTFDDGPDPVNTPKVLDLLRQNRVRATFCVVGTQVRAHPDLVRRIGCDS